MINLKGSALKIVEALNEQGFLCLAVGGFVRASFTEDEIPSDLDLVTDAPCEKALEILKGNHFKVLPIGLKHQTITVMIGDHAFELSSFREGSCDLVQDASHRDFTINALYQNLESGEILDPLKGKADITDRLLRFVLSPEERILEDPLRILRAYRFYSTLGYEFEDETLFFCRKHRHLLLEKITPERLHHELLKILSGKFYTSLIEKHFDILLSLMPELRFEEVILPHTSKPLLRLAGLLHYHDEKTLKIISKRFLLSNFERDYLCFFSQGFAFLSSKCELKSVRHFINTAHQQFTHLAPELLNDFILFTQTRSRFGEHRRLLFDQMLLSPQGFMSPLTGQEIQKFLKLEQGIEIGKYKKYLQEQVEEGVLSLGDKEQAYQFLRVLKT